MDMHRGTSLTDRIIVVGSEKPERKIQDRYQIYSGGGISPTLRARDYKDPPRVLIDERDKDFRELNRRIYERT